MRIKLEQPQKKAFEEKKQEEQKRKCPVCGNLFIPKWGYQVYCNATCRTYAKSIQIKEYMKRKRSKKIGEKAIFILENLAKQQQFVDDKNIIQKEKCLACGFTDNLVEHHIKYIPEEKIILCKKCHMFLHNNLLNGQRCRPRILKCEKV